MKLFYKNDRVRLKGGGPAMTVVGVLKSGNTSSARWLRIGRREGEVLCRWLDDSCNDEIVRPFPPDELEAVDGDEM